MGYCSSIAVQIELKLSVLDVYPPYNFPDAAGAGMHAFYLQDNNFPTRPARGCMHFTSRIHNKDILFLHIVYKVYID